LHQSKCTDGLRTNGHGLAGAGAWQMTELNSSEVVNEIESGRLVLVRNGLESELVYQCRNRQLILVHTGVPEGLRGNGLGSGLIEAAVGWAERDGLVVVPWCPFARRWLQEHGVVSSRVQIDWETRPELAPAGAEEREIQIEQKMSDDGPEAI
jgi:uncharacterized protein